MQNSKALDLVAYEVSKASFTGGLIDGLAWVRYVFRLMQFQNRTFNLDSSFVVSFLLGQINKKLCS